MLASAVPRRPAPRTVGRSAGRPCGCIEQTEGACCRDSREEQRRRRGGKSAKKSRTDVWREEQEAALAAKQVAIRAAQPPGQEPPQHETIVKIGRVEKYDPRAMSGIVSILEPKGRINCPSR